MTDTTLTIAKLALDAALMRQTAIASNVANSQSKNYQPIEVNFEQQLEGLNPEEVTQVTPFYQPSDKTSSLDEQMVLNVQNMTQYRALIKGINQKLSIMKMALQGNNA